MFNLSIVSYFIFFRFYVFLRIWCHFCCTILLIFFNYFSASYNHFYISWYSSLHLFSYFFKVYSNYLISYFHDHQMHLEFFVSIFLTQRLTLQLLYLNFLFYSLINYFFNLFLERLFFFLFTFLFFVIIISLCCYNILLFYIVLSLNYRAYYSYYFI